MWILPVALPCHGPALMSPLIVCILVVVVLTTILALFTLTSLILPHDDWRIQSKCWQKGFQFQVCNREPTFHPSSYNPLIYLCNSTVNLRRWVNVSSSPGVQSPKWELPLSTSTNTIHTNNTHTYLHNLTEETNIKGRQLTIVQYLKLNQQQCLLKWQQLSYEHHFLFLKDLIIGWEKNIRHTAQNCALVLVPDWYYILSSIEEGLHWSESKSKHKP